MGSRQGDSYSETIYNAEYIIITVISTLIFRLYTELCVKKNNKQQKIVTVKALASLSYCFSVSIDTDTFTRKAENDFLDRFFYMNIAHAIGFLSGGF